MFLLGRVGARCDCSNEDVEWETRAEREEGGGCDGGQEEDGGGSLHRHPRPHPERPGGQPGGGGARGRSSRPLDRGWRLHDHGVRDKQTGTARKHYIGMVTMLDILAHIGRSNGGGGSGDGFDFEGMMSVPVSSLIGRCLEGRSMWTLHPSTSILECMEMFSKGIHRALVPIDGHTEKVSGVELVESASSYRMLTQMDVLSFVREHAPELNSVMSCTVGELGVIHDTVFGVSDATQVMDAIKCMQAASLYAVPIIQASDATDDHSQLINGKGRKLVGTFSATDLRSCPVNQLQPWLHLGVVEFAEKVSAGPLHYGSSTNSTGVPRELVTCFAESCLGEAIDMAVTKHVHRVWVVDGQGLLLGLVSLTDMIRAVRISLLPDPTVI